MDPAAFNQLAEYRSGGRAAGHGGGQLRDGGRGVWKRGQEKMTCAAISGPWPQLHLGEVFRQSYMPGANLREQTAFGLAEVEGPSGLKGSL